MVYLLQDALLTPLPWLNEKFNGDVCDNFLIGFTSLFSYVLLANLYSYSQYSQLHYTVEL